LAAADSVREKPPRDGEPGARPAATASSSGAGPLVKNVSSDADDSRTGTAPPGELRPDRTAFHENRSRPRRGRCQRYRWRLGQSCIVLEELLHFVRSAVFSKIALRQN